MADPVGRCSLCNYEIESFDGLTCCPNCGTTSTPVSTTDDVQVDVNWHDLRCMVMWAERWANQGKDKYPDMLRLVYNVARRLQQQFPDKTPLTLFAEIEEIKKEFRVVETHGIPEPPPSLLTKTDAVSEAERILEGGNG